MARKNYTAGERAVAVIGVLAGNDLDTINDQIKADRGRDGGDLKLLNPESYKMLVRKYASTIEQSAGQDPRWVRAWEHITAPKAMGDL
jgi:hypothetical protein